MSTAARIISVKPVVLPTPERGTELQIRISAPESGTALPVVVFAHGFGESMDSYSPLLDSWVSHGFVVVQPTFLDSRTLGIGHDDPRFPDIWRFRVDDLKRTVDHLEAIVGAVPGLADRVDLGLLAIAGHSWGAQSAGMLLGARVLDEHGEPGPDERDDRIKAGVLLAATGLGDDLTPFAQEHLPFMRPDFSAMTTPALIVAGDHDQSQLSTRGPDWFVDPYTFSPGPKALLTVFGGEHLLGGIQGHNAADTTDESPERVAFIREAARAYLLDALGIDRGPWSEVHARPQNHLGTVESK